MIKVVEAISDSNIGGAGILLLNRIKHTDHSIFDVNVVLPNNSQLKDRFLEQDVKIIPSSSCKDKSFDLRGIFEYVKILKKIRPDIINAHGCMTARIAARITGVPVKLYTRHCVYPVGRIYKNPVMRFAVRIFTNILSDRVVAVAHSAKNNLTDMGVAKNRISTIINGAEALRAVSNEEKKQLREKYGISTDDFVAVICARLEKCKDHDTFLKAAEILCRESDKYKFFIIGTGSRELYLKKLSRELNIDKNVIFTGFLADVAPCMNICDLNVNCSVGTETSSLALSEGMSIGKPCVASDYGGNTYMVRDGENGYIYKAADYIDLAAKIRLVANMKWNDLSKYGALCKKSKKRYQNELNARAMTQSTQELYLQMLKSKKYRPR